MLSEINSELARLNANHTTVTLDADFEPKVGELVNVEVQGAYWHLLPDAFLTLLKELPDRAGDDAIRSEIERKGMFVWHGPAPEGSRDTSP